MNTDLLNILLIEDDEVDQLTFERLFKKVSTQVNFKIESDLSSAHDFIKNEAVDLIFCDFNLPDGNALDFLNHTKNQRHFEIVVMTGLGDIEKATESLKNGAFDFITKDNIDIPTVESILNRFSKFKRENNLRIQLEAELQKNYNSTKSILDHSNDGIWSLSADQKLIFANQLTEKSVQKYFNYTPKAGDLFLENVPEEYSSVWSSMFQDAIQGKPIRQTNKFFDGQHFFYLETSCNPTYNDNEIDGVVYVSRNITTRKLNEEKILESEKNFRSVFEGSQVPILIEELKNNTIIDLNEACAELHKYSRIDMIGMKVYDTIPPDFLTESQKNYNQLLKKNLEYLESFVFTSDKQSIPVRIDVNRIMYHGQECNILFMHDISIQKKQEDELKRAREFAEQTAEFKSLFLANMSHEIRTPMNALIGFADLLNDTSLDSEQEEYVNVIKRSGEDLLVIINDILDLSKIQAGKMDLRIETVDLFQILRQLIQLHQYKAESKGLELTLNVGNNLPQFVEADPTRLTQILNNLVSNGIKFTEKGKVIIKASAEQINKNQFQITFEVQDSGIGIPEEKIDDVFTDFSQVDSTFQRKHQGTGLGLSISKALADLMGGTLSLKSVVNQGSTFTLTVPFQKGAQLNKPIQNSDLSLSKKGLNILVAEDNEINIMLAKRILTKLDLTAHYAANGQEAVDMAKKINPNVIFMDIQMPIMDGLEATKLIREFSDVPIFAMTAHVLEEERKKCFDVGMNGFIPKPFKKNDIFQALSDYEVSESENRPTDPISELGIKSLSELADGDIDFTVNLLTAFQKNALQAVSETKKGLEEQDYAIIKHHAHKMRPSFILLEYKELELLSTELEKQEDQFDKVQGFIDMLVSVIRDIDEMITKLKPYH